MAAKRGRSPARFPSVRLSSNNSPGLDTYLPTDLETAICLTSKPISPSHSQGHAEKEQADPLLSSNQKQDDTIIRDCVIELCSPGQEKDFKEHSIETRSPMLKELHRPTQSEFVTLIEKPEINVRKKRECRSSHNKDESLERNQRDRKRLEVSENPTTENVRKKRECRSSHHKDESLERNQRDRERLEVSGNPTVDFLGEWRDTIESEDSENVYYEEIPKEFIKFPFVKQVMLGLCNDWDDETQAVVTTVDNGQIHRPSLASEDLMTVGNGPSLSGSSELPQTIEEMFNQVMRHASLETGSSSSIDSPSSSASMSKVNVDDENVNHVGNNEDGDDKEKDEGGEGGGSKQNIQTSTMEINKSVHEFETNESRPVVTGKRCANVKTTSAEVEEFKDIPKESGIDTATDKIIESGNIGYGGVIDNNTMSKHDIKSINSFNDIPDVMINDPTNFDPSNDGQKGVIIDESINGLPSIIIDEITKSGDISRKPEAATDAINEAAETEENPGKLFGITEICKPNDSVVKEYRDDKRINNERVEISPSTTPDSNISTVKISDSNDGLNKSMNIESIEKMCSNNDLIVSDFERTHLSKSQLCGISDVVCRNSEEDNNAIERTECSENKDIETSFDLTKPSPTALDRARKLTRDALSRIRSRSPTPTDVRDALDNVVQAGRSLIEKTKNAMPCLFHEREKHFVTFSKEENIDIVRQSIPMDGVPQRHDGTKESHRITTNEIYDETGSVLGVDTEQDGVVKDLCDEVDTLKQHQHTTNQDKITCENSKTETDRVRSNKFDLLFLVNKIKHKTQDLKQNISTNEEELRDSDNIHNKTSLNIDNGGGGKVLNGATSVKTNRHPTSNHTVVDISNNLNESKPVTESEKTVTHDVTNDSLLDVVDIEGSKNNSGGNKSTVYAQNDQKNQTCKEQTQAFAQIQRKPLQAIQKTGTLKRNENIRGTVSQSYMPLEETDVSGSEDVPRRSVSLVTSMDADHQDRELTEMMALISDDVSLKRYPSLADLTDLENDQEKSLSRSAQFKDAHHRAIERNDEWGKLFDTGEKSNDGIIKPLDNKNNPHDLDYDTDEDQRSSGLSSSAEISSSSSGGRRKTTSSSATTPPNSPKSGVDKEASYVGTIVSLFETTSILCSSTSQDGEMADRPSKDEYVRLKENQRLEEIKDALVTEICCHRKALTTKETIDYVCKNLQNTESLQEVHDYVQKEEDSLDCMFSSNDLFHNNLKNEEYSFNIIVQNNYPFQGDVLTEDISNDGVEKEDTLTDSIQKEDELNGSVQKNDKLSDSVQKEEKLNDSVPINSLIHDNVYNKDPLSNSHHIHKEDESTTHDFKDISALECLSFRSTSNEQIWNRTKNDELMDYLIEHLPSPPNTSLQEDIADTAPFHDGSQASTSKTFMKGKCSNSISMHPRVCIGKERERLEWGRSISDSDEEFHDLVISDKSDGKIVKSGKISLSCRRQCAEDGQKQLMKSKWPKPPIPKRPNTIMHSKAGNSERNKTLLDPSTFTLKNGTPCDTSNPNVKVTDDEQQRVERSDRTKPPVPKRPITISCSKGGNNENIKSGRESVYDCSPLDKESPSDSLNPNTLVTKLNLTLSEKEPGTPSSCLGGFSETRDSTGQSGEVNLKGDSKGDSCISSNELEDKNETYHSGVPVNPMDRVQLEKPSDNSLDIEGCNQTRRSKKDDPLKNELNQPETDKQEERLDIPNTSRNSRIDFMDEQDPDLNSRIVPILPILSQSSSQYVGKSTDHSTKRLRRRHGTVTWDLNHDVPTNNHYESDDSRDDDEEENNSCDRCNSCISSKYPEPTDEHKFNDYSGSMDDLTVSLQNHQIRESPPNNSSLQTFPPSFYELKTNDERNVGNNSSKLQNKENIGDQDLDNSSAAMIQSVTEFKDQMNGLQRWGGDQCSDDSVDITKMHHGNEDQNYVLNEMPQDDISTEKSIDPRVLEQLLLKHDVILGSTEDESRKQTLANNTVLPSFPKHGESCFKGDNGEHSVVSKKDNHQIVSTCYKGDNLVNSTTTSSANKENSHSPYHHHHYDLKKRNGLKRSFSFMSPRIDADASNYHKLRALQLNPQLFSPANKRRSLSFQHSSLNSYNQSAKQYSCAPGNERPPPPQPPAPLAASMLAQSNSVIPNTSDKLSKTFEETDRILERVSQSIEMGISSVNTASEFVQRTQTHVLLADQLIARSLETLRKSAQVSAIVAEQLAKVDRFLTSDTIAQHNVTASLKRRVSQK